MDSPLCYADYFCNFLILNVLAIEWFEFLTTVDIFLEI